MREIFFFCKNAPNDTHIFERWPVVKKVLFLLARTTHWLIYLFSREIQYFWSLRSRISCLASPLLHLATLGLRKLASLCMKFYAQGPKKLNFPLKKINLPVFRDW